MRIAFDNRKDSFSKRWEDYCIDNQIQYERVDYKRSDIVDYLRNFDYILWHWTQQDPSSILFAKQLLYSLEIANRKVFPNFNTIWHFDDKIGQKYLFESLDIPHVDTHIFYNKVDANRYVKNIKYPIVFKLSRGAGSANVKLIKNRKMAERIIEKSFTKGFKPFPSIFADQKKNIQKTSKKEIFRKVLKIPRIYRDVLLKNKKMGREIGYVYLQNFIPNNNYDIRIVVIGNRAFGLKRIVRKNDFRASGSGNIVYNKKEIDINCIKIAFEMNNKINAQSIAFDFIYEENNPKIIEISYGFKYEAYDKCEGFWDANLQWHNENVNAPDFIIEDLIKNG